MKKKLLFIIPYLGGGGAERVMLTLLNNLSREKYDLHLCLIKEKGNYLNQLEKNVTVHLLNCRSFILSFNKLYRCIKKVDPDIVIGFLSFVIVYLGLVKIFFLKKNIFIARETGLPSSRKRFLGNNSKMLCTITYGAMDVIISQCHYQKDELISYYKISPNKVRLIANPTDCNVPEYNYCRCPDDKVNLISAGSLEERKNYRSVIEAMDLCQDESIILHIYGDGPLRDELSRQIQSLHLQDRVLLHGHIHNLKDHFIQCDAYIMPSKFEVCSNALLEAQACGLPAIAYNCPGANAEIIIEGVTGFLAENNNVEMLAQIISEKKYLHMDRKFIHNHIERHFGIDSSIEQYEQLFDKVLQKTIIT